MVHLYIYDNDNSNVEQLFDHKSKEKWPAKLNLAQHLPFGLEGGILSISCLFEHNIEIKVAQDCQLDVSMQISL
jgi:hypothetical protein